MLTKAIPIVMAKPIQSFPDGAAGFALAALRLSGAVIAWPAFLAAARFLGDWFPTATAATLLILALATGLCTRAAALTLIGALACGLASGWPGLLPSLSALLASLSLLLLGPGAFSLDARRFGRRVIRVGPTPPDGGRPGSLPSGLRKGDGHENV